MSYLIRKTDNKVFGVFKIIFKWRKWYLFKDVSPKHLYDSLVLAENMGLFYYFVETSPELEKYRKSVVLPEWFKTNLK